MAQAMDRPARLIDMPVWFLLLLGKLTGKSGAIQRLCGNLQVDISKTKAVLDWKPPIGVDEGLRRAAAQWRK
jgi:nucleoside-diphosphate-sugar epimerase